MDYLNAHYIPGQLWIEKSLLLLCFHNIILENRISENKHVKKGGTF